ncbi:protein FAR1-RELATED SEQUENCE 5-like [Camellia sinensis]|uniref:protein FAR1-RELATED SEQUENCE 5-like n=1 Tax=Camellia sinensis TaxID=4442 RepID=UPI001036F309|nr:protein FAR1-RELATED SEQUENCE 5-like [Camellia sinensis]
MAKAIPIVMPSTNHRLCTWHLMQNAVKHVSSLFQDVGVKSVFSKFMHQIDDEEEFKIQWDQMLDRYDTHNNHWLAQTFGVKEKWGWPYIMNSWAAGMSTTQLSESFNAFLKDYLNCDHNLMEFFKHFERVLYGKRYKKLEAEYNLCQKLPRVSIPTMMLKQMENIYTKTIFEEFQNEYVQSIEASIVGTIHDSESTIFTIQTDVDEKKDKNVTMDRDGFLSCSCKKFEVKGIVCQHCLKVLREIINAKDLPAQYKKMVLFLLIKVNLNLLPTWGVYTPQGQSRPPFAMGSNYVEGHGRAIYISQSRPESQSQPSFAMGHTNYVEGHGRAIYISQPQSQSRLESQSQPSFAMGRTSVHHVMYPTYDGNNTPQSMPPDSMPLVYPTPTSFQKLLRDTTAIQLLQASHSPADSHVDGHPWKACTKR